MRQKIIQLVIACGICLSAGIIGSTATYPAISGWYANLLKPEFNPPNWIFGPVWTTLYLLMGISLFRIWQKETRSEKKTKSLDKKSALWVFSIQLLLNTGWSLIFFGLKNPMLAFFEIVIMWIFILLTIIKFNKIDKIAAILLVPYLLWVSFATVLNYFIWQLNP